MGSLVCALASYLDARANNGQWLVRIEDIDPPREQAGAHSLILESLAKHGLESDQRVLFQSQRHDAYSATLNTLAQRQLSYRCNCTRARLKQLESLYDQHCLSLAPPPNSLSAIRLNQQAALLSLDKPTLDPLIDGVLGPLQLPLDPHDDFVIHRKDGLFAYQLAVVVDDIEQGITHVVRGADLLSTTNKQRLLFFTLGSSPPHYSHIPLVTDSRGHKLSKQNHAPAIQSTEATANLTFACELLGLCNNKERTTLQHKSVTTILQWATGKWDIRALPTHPIIG
jgi:Glutamyl- and glutaminyl-tRNA synthetases